MINPKAAREAECSVCLGHGNLALEGCKHYPRHTEDCCACGGTGRIQGGKHD